MTSSLKWGILILMIIVFLGVGGYLAYSLNSTYISPPSSATPTITTMQYVLMGVLAVILLGIIGMSIYIGVS